MPDITMCQGVSDETGEHCPLKANCYRFTATPSKWRQSYFVSTPVRDGECQYFCPAALKQEPRT